MSKLGKIELFNTDFHSLEIEKSSSISECLIFLVKSQGFKQAPGILGFTRFIVAEENSDNERANILAKRIHN